MLAWVLTVIALVAFLGSTTFMIWRWRRRRRRVTELQRMLTYEDIKSQLEGLIKRDVQ